MFTGIIEDVGVVQKIAPSVLLVRTVLTEIKKGDSIAANGTCLTVTKMASSARTRVLSFDVSPETVQRTNLGELRGGSNVNLERALRAGDRFGGHIMTGHIEDKGKLVRKERIEKSWIFTFTLDRHLRRYIVPKGSVGVDGISLTVVDCGSDFFTVSVIPHTMKNTNLGSRKLGDNVNIEPDILAKYAESMLVHDIGETKTTKELLKEYGFIQ
ncbi:MAG: riboflavin synthase [Ignavibacteriales bacterium]|nr:riboflavin synthase [Ignavibacteriales bacterium]